MNGPSPEDLAVLERYAAALADGLEAAIGPWVERCVTGTIEATGGLVTGTIRTRARDAGERATAEVIPPIRALLAQDVDAQRSNPLALVREAVVFPTEVLQDAGVAPVERDETARAMFPDDVYDLTPGSFAEVDPALAGPGIEWGAAKAHVHLARRRA